MQHGLSDVVKRANNMPSLSQIKCRYFQIDGINVGLLPPKTFEKLRKIACENDPRGVYNLKIIKNCY